MTAHGFMLPLTRSTETTKSHCKSISVVGAPVSLLTLAACKRVGVLDRNAEPVGVAETLSATEDTAVTYAARDLLGNDTDADGNTLSIKSVTAITGGTAVLNQDGTVTFTPTANFNGAASFSYIATDGTADTASTTVTVNVGAANDAPVMRASLVVVQRVSLEKIQDRVGVPTHV